MALPLAPVAGIALRYGAVALIAWAVTRAADPARRDQRAEDAHDDLPDGVGLRSESGQANLNGRLRRIVRLGPTGPGVEIDASLLGRLRMRRV
jgi:hypothetical protein